MNKIVFSLLGLFLLSLSLPAQVAMGKWRTHLAYNIVNQIVQSDNKVFAVSEGSLFSIDKRDGGMEFYSKLSGLNGTVISRIAYDDADKTLLIIYQDGNIDFMSASGVKNLPDYYNKQMSINKSVNHILFDENKAYLSCNFGIMILNMRKMEIQDTYFIGDNASEVVVKNTAIARDNIYAVTDNEIFFAQKSNPNLISYEYWNKMTGLPGSGNYEALYGFGDYLVLLRGGKIYKQDAGGTWSDVDNWTDYLKISVSNNFLQGYTAGGLNVFDQQFSKTEITGLSNLKDGVYDNANSSFWFAGDIRGVAQYKLNSSSPEVSFYLPEGPAVNIPYKLQFFGDRLFVLQGGRWAAQDLRPAIVMIYENNTWKTISNLPIEAQIGHVIKDFINVAVDPNDKTHFYAVSYGMGIFEFKNDEFYKWYNFMNSPVMTIFPNHPIDSYYYMRAGGGYYDPEGNIWFTNSGVAMGLFVLKKDGTFSKFTSPLLTGETLGEVLFFKENPNYKWLINSRSGSFTAIDDKGTLDNDADDTYKVLKVFPDPDKEGGTISVNDFFCAVRDEKNGSVWIGTNKGPLVFNRPLDAFKPDFGVTKIKIPRNDSTNLADYLLESEIITAIAIDGGNRKWIGTDASGIYLMDESGQNTIHHFTTQNSPLISNKILSIAIHPTTGEVFIGSGGGLVSYQSDAGKAESVFNNVHVYPNPVRENFNGVITITGLVENTTLKIMDVAGHLVCETTSNGSIATWDGKDKFGRKVSTGVYVVMCITPEGDQSTTTKVMVIN